MSFNTTPIEITTYILDFAVNCKDPSAQTFIHNYNKFGLVCKLWREIINEFPENMIKTLTPFVVKDLTFYENFHEIQLLQAKKIYLKAFNEPCRLIQNLYLNRASQQGFRPATDELVKRLREEKQIKAESLENYALALKDLKSDKISDLDNFYYFACKLFEENTFCEIDPLKAAYFFKRMADEGIAKGHYGLACCLITGSGLKKDLAQSFYHYEKALELHLKSLESSSIPALENQDIIKIFNNILDLTDEQLEMAEKTITMLYELKDNIAIRLFAILMAYINLSKENNAKCLEYLVRAFTSKFDGAYVPGQVEIPKLIKFIKDLDPRLSPKLIEYLTIQDARQITHNENF